MLLPLLLTAAGLLAALLPVGLGLANPPDAVPLAVTGAGVVWSWLAWRKRRGTRPMLAALLATCAAAGLAWWMLVFSHYAPAEGVPRVGDQAPEIAAVRVRDGARFRMSAERGGRVLLVFFRGEW